VAGKLTAVKPTDVDKKAEFVSSAGEAGPDSKRGRSAGGGSGKEEPSSVGGLGCVGDGRPDRKADGPMNLVFRPTGNPQRRVCGAGWREIFELVWGLVDDQDPPEPKHRDLSLGRLVAALAL